MTIPADSRTRNLMNNSISINAMLSLHVTNPSEREWQHWKWEQPTEFGSNLDPLQSIAHS